MPSEDSVFTQIETLTAGDISYKESLETLSKEPIGYGFCFAFHHINTDVCNGGISQLYANSTWALIPTAVQACKAARCFELEQLLRKIVLYYHQKGRSRLKRQIPENFFGDLEHTMCKSLAELEDEFFSLIDQRNAVVPNLLATESAEMWGGA
jgi:hypothetical protein